MSRYSDLMGRILGEGARGEISSSSPAEADPGAATASPESLVSVDVVAILNEKESEHPDELDWKRSIVDLLKLVGMDSSYGARKEIALELGYRQAEIDSKGSAEMNIWLHKQVMKRLSKNGGKVPAELLD